MMSKNYTFTEEELAEYTHNARADVIDNYISICINDNVSMMIKPYKDLSEEEKQSNRDVVAKLMEDK